MKKLITLTDITFAYSPDEPDVFDGFNFDVKRNECIVIFGENGSGKSTLFRILNGLSFPQKGSYTFDGIDITSDYLKNNKNAKAFHKRIGYLFQNPDIMLFSGRVYDEIAFGPRQMGLSDTEVDTRVNDLMKLFNITDLSDKAPYHLSGGQKKRVAFAAVMALNPEVLILDEPFAGLDTASEDFFLSFIKELKKSGKTIIIASHKKELKEILADRTISLS